MRVARRTGNQLAATLTSIRSTAGRLRWWLGPQCRRPPERLDRQHQQYRRRNTQGHPRPGQGNASPSRRTMRRTAGWEAPSAMRIPISAVRRLTSHDITLHRPIIASSRPSAPIEASMIVEILRSTNSRLVASLVVCTSTKTLPSCSAIARFTAAMLSAGGPAVRACRIRRPPICRNGRKNCGRGCPPRSCTSRPRRHRRSPARVRDCWKWARAPIGPARPHRENASFAKVSLTITTALQHRWPETRGSLEQRDPTVPK